MAPTNNIFFGGNKNFPKFLRSSRCSGASGVPQNWSPKIKIKSFWNKIFG